MQYAIIIDDAISEYPVNLRVLLPNTSVCEDWPGSVIDGTEYAAVYPTPQPEYDPEAQTCTEGTPVKDGDIWVQSWIITDIVAPVHHEAD